jgi:hypothetical protein
MMLWDSWSMIYVSLIYVSMKKQASKQKNLSVSETILDRIKQSTSYLRIIIKWCQIITWHIFSALKKLNHLAKFALMLKINFFVALCSVFRVFRIFETSFFTFFFAFESSFFRFICYFHKISFLIYLFEIIRCIFWLIKIVIHRIHRDMIWNFVFEIHWHRVLFEIRLHWVIFFAIRLHRHLIFISWDLNLIFLLDEFIVFLFDDHFFDEHEIKFNDE